ncbi:MAG: DUF5123 domain-containing protein [Bacteroidota bacterium]
MKNTIIIFVISILSCFMVSCEKDYNDWEVESGHDRLFRSLIFEVSKVQSTSVELKFTKTISATKYVFEFSKDNLQFKEIVKTVELSASSLVPFANSTNQAKVEYRELFDGLDGTTGYSVRMKSIDEGTGKESGYNQVYFETPAEQIFTKAIPTTNSLKLQWILTPRVTNVVLYNENMQEIKNVTLTQEQKTAAEITFDNLTIGTKYIVKIFNDVINRGTLNVSTSGIANSQVYNVLTSDNASSIGTALSNMVSGGATNITVAFAQGISYTIGGDITVPTGVNDIAFVGAADSNGKLPVLSNARFRVQSKINNLIIQYLETTSAGSFFVDLGGKKVNNVNIQGCNVSNINSIIIVSSGSVVNDINVSNSLISKTGGYGVFNVGSGTTVNSINATNCTLTEISTRFADVRIATKINFKNITCVNINTAMSHLWLFNNSTPVELSIQNLIVGGPNAGAKINSTNGIYSNIPISYAGSYQTNDLITDTRALSGITIVPLNISGLFVDPTKGDFHIKPGIGFAGTGVAGDSRWFN